MNEMLGNQYFLTRRFHDAAQQYEKALFLNSKNNNIKKKLIICYLQLNHISLALELFTELISEKIEVVTNTQPNKEDCPCVQMINELENFPSKLTQKEIDTSLGILWLYCDVSKSREYFDKLIKNDPQNSLFQKINSILIKSFQKNHKVGNNGEERYIS